MNREKIAKEIKARRKNLYFINTILGRVDGDLGRLIIGVEAVGKDTLFSNAKHQRILVPIGRGGSEEEDMKNLLKKWRTEIEQKVEDLEAQLKNAALLQA